MEQDREIEQVMMNISKTGGQIASLVVLSTKLNLMLLTFVLRMAKKGLIATGLADGFKGFVTQSKGEFTVYNVPVSAEHAENVSRFNRLQSLLEKTKNPVEKSKLRKEMKVLETNMPEFQQLQKLGISHFMLPKVNGSEHTIQIAVANSDQQIFKNWFLNHLTSELSGGSKGMEELKAFTEDNYSIFNLPFEGEELQEALPDFDILGLNYHILPDLKVGDGNSQLAIPNADRNKLEVWFKMWKDKQMQMGKETGEMYSLDNQSYLATGEMEQGDYIAASEQIYQDANQEFETQSKAVPWDAPLGKENSEEFVKYLQNQNFEKITINKETLVDNMQLSGKTYEMQKNGYFASRIPGTYGTRQQTLLIPRNQVFSGDDGKTYIAFLEKNQKSYVMTGNGELTERGFQETYRPYASVQRSFRNVENLKEDAVLTRNAARTPNPNAKNHKFNNFEQRNYDMKKLEAALLNAQKQKL